MLLQLVGEKGRKVTVFRQKLPSVRPAQGALPPPRQLVDKRRVSPPQRLDQSGRDGDVLAQCSVSRGLSSPGWTWRSLLGPWGSVAVMLPSPAFCGHPPMSHRQQNKVVVDINHRHVEGGHLVHAQALVPGRVQLLRFQLPLHPLHGIQGRSLVLLPHEEAGLHVVVLVVQVLELEDELNWWALGRSRTDLLLSPWLSRGMF